MNQKNWKVFTLCVLLVISALTFAGCGNNDGMNNPDEATTGGTQLPENNTTSTDNTAGTEGDSVLDDAGNAVGDVVDGAGNAVGDAVDGVENAVDDITDNDNNTNKSTLNDAITSTAAQTDISGGATKNNR